MLENTMAGVLEPVVPWHPFADLLGIEQGKKAEGMSQCSITFSDKLLNPNGVVHGGVIYALADNSMGGALQSLLEPTEKCATIEIKITYLFAANQKKQLSSKANVIKKGSRVAMLECDVFEADRLVAKATGTFAVFSTA